MEIGKMIKDARIQSGLTQEQAALEIMVSRQTISNWENSKSLPDIISVLKMSDLYQISLDDLLKGDDEMKKQIEKDTDVVGTNRRLIAVGWSAIVIMIMLIFACVVSGNAIFVLGLSCIFIVVTIGYCNIIIHNNSSK